MVTASWKALLSTREMLPFPLQIVIWQDKFWIMHISFLFMPLNYTYSGFTRKLFSLHLEL